MEFISSKINLISPVPYPAFFISLICFVVNIFHLRQKELKNRQQLYIFKKNSKTSRA